MAVANQAYSYDDQAVREDLLDVMTNLDPTETQLISGLKSPKMTNMIDAQPSHLYIELSSLGCWYANSVHQLIQTRKNK